MQLNVGFTTSNAEEHYRRERHRGMAPESALRRIVPELEAKQKARLEVTT